MKVVLEKIHSDLVAANVLTGKEDPTQVAGIVVAGATTGVKNTTEALVRASSQVTGQVTGALNEIGGAGNAALRAIKSGNLAANLAQSAQNALGGLKQSVAQMIKAPGLASLIEQTKGAAASAFGAITAGWAKLKPNVPQNLKDINSKKAAELKEPAPSALSGIAQSASTIGSNLVATAGNVIGRTLAPATSVVSSGLSVLPGGAQVATVLANAATTGLAKIPGTERVAGMIKDAQAAAMNGLPQPIETLAAAKDGLIKFASDGLPADEAAQLTAFTAGAGSTGDTSVELPSVTTISGNDRSAIDGAVATVLVDKRIPIPSFSPKRDQQA